MQNKNHKITIESYLDFQQIFQDYKGTHKENRLFALKHEQAQTPVLLWLEEHRFRRIKPFNSDTFSLYSHSLNNIVSFVSLLLGLIVGMGLLSYSGNEPVNIIYYLFFATLLPIISMLFTLFTLFSKWNISDFFKMLFPFHWFEKLVARFTMNKKVEFLDEVLSKPLQKHLFIERLQRFSLIFSIGTLIALLFIVVTQDIAFSWSTTLQVDALSFYGFLEFIATPWRFFFPSCMPSLELVELSQHYRLGVRLDTNLIENANRLGAWWQYLAMNTFFYAIVLRFSLWVYSLRILNKKIEEEFFDLYGVRKLLREFRTPLVETKAPKKEKHLEIKKEHKKQVKKVVELKEPEPSRVLVKPEVSKALKKEEPKKVKITEEEPREEKPKVNVEVLEPEVIKKELLKEELKEEVQQEETPKKETLLIEEPQEVETFKEEIIEHEAIIEPEKVEECVEEEVFDVLEEEYHTIVAWNFSDDEVLLINDSKNIRASFVASVGGSHSFEEDEEVIRQAGDNVLFYVKSWEPPTMDFVDFLEELIENENVYEIELFPLGLPENSYKGTEKEFSIWNRKIEGLKAKKVWVIDAK
jgi:hypothetical protein